MRHPLIHILGVCLPIALALGCGRLRPEKLEPEYDPRGTAFSGGDGPSGDTRASGDSASPGGDLATGDRRSGDAAGGAGDTRLGDTLSGDTTFAGGDGASGDFALWGGDDNQGDSVIAGDTTGPTPSCNPTTPPRGAYTYRRLPIGGLSNSVRVAFHPDGSYAAILELFDEIHIFDWATETATAFDLKPAGGNFYPEDIQFLPDGTGALIVGHHNTSSGIEGVVYWLDDGAWRAQPGGMDPVFTQWTGATRANPLAAIALDPDGNFGPIVLERGGGPSFWTATLRELDIGMQAWNGLVAANNSSAGCNDIAFVDNEFGQPGIFIACGNNGADTLYYTWVASTPEWRVDPGNNNLGNTARVDTACNADYALVVSWSGRALYRFEGGLLNGYSDAPRFSTMGIWNVSFAPDGARALITGRTSVTTGTILEYRHGAYSCASLSNPSCGTTDVSIPNFTSPPWNGTSNTYLHDSAFRPGCDGGLIVGGDNTLGMVIEFQNDTGVDCRP